MPSSMTELWTQIGSSMAGIMFVWAMFQQYFPYELRKYFQFYFHKLIAFFSPYIVITFHEYAGTSRFKRSDAYQSIETYLGVNSSSRASRFKAEQEKDSQSVVLSMDEYQEVTDEFRGVKLWWTSSKTVSKAQTISFYPNDDKRYYKLTFHRRHRKIVTEAYLDYILQEGKSLTIKNRQRKLFTNCKNEKWGDRGSLWSHVVFEHPASFDTLAMEEDKKKDIMSDLVTFSKGKDYYKKIGKAWKRGYLLYGPPGTGKSTMIAAMANFLEYDIYDLELTSVKDNTELRKLLIETSSKSIMVIEDIDCSLDLTGQRNKKGKKDDKEDKDDDGKDPIKKAVENEGKSKPSEVTLSGLLNFIDGLWSSFGGERIIVFTTNYVEKLDPALIRRGRMDKRIELSYCCFEAFKVLAKNYLDVYEHELFELVKKGLEETEMTPADVAENLMPKCAEDNAETCLKSLVEALEKAKEDARVKAEEEAKEKIEEEEKAKAKAEKKEADASDKEAEEEKKSVADKKVKENGVVNGTA